jgi:hypothetical protein
VKQFRNVAVAGLLALSMFTPRTSNADMFGGDIAVLVQILAQAVQQLAELQSILGTGEDTLGLMRDLNSGIRDGLSVLHIVDPKLNPGLYGDLNTSERVLESIQSVYGKVPQTGEAKLQAAQDQSVAETIAMNSTLFKFADQADEEGHRIFDHSQDVSPQGAAKLTAQSMAVLIGVTTQVLRTNSMMLKMMAENMALQNKHEKLQSAHFRTEYDGISSALGDLPKDTSIKPLGGGAQ